MNWKPCLPRWRLQLAPSAIPVFDWSRLFQAAGLDMSRFQATEARWTPLANWDARAAWSGDDPETGDKLRVEAAAWRGKPVFFRIIGPWTVPERMTPPSNTRNQIPVVVIIYIALFSACGIAWHNFRAGKTDRRGALRLGGVYFLAMACSRFLSAHHTATMQELDGFWHTVAISLINGGALWVIYLALEPWVRRRWPHTMIGWTRYTAQGIRDPLVGRDLLVGSGLRSPDGWGDHVGYAFPREWRSAVFAASGFPHGCPVRVREAAGRLRQCPLRRLVLLLRALWPARASAQTMDRSHSFRDDYVLHSRPSEPALRG